MAASFELYKDSAGEFRWRLKSANGLTIATGGEGYTNKAEPYHGYYFKILKGQGPEAPLGKMDFVIHGVMIGGFALVAAPADYRATGVMTFIVSHDGVVYQKDLGPKTLEQFQKMELFNPDKTWTPVDRTTASSGPPVNAESPSRP